MSYVVAGKYKFASLEKAKAVAEEIFAKTGIVVAIEKKEIKNV